MARRKRASLKNKDPETLGLTPKKGKGIDMLFGGPLEKKDSATTSSPLSDPEEPNDTTPSESEEATTATPEQSNDDSSGSAEETAVTPPAAPAIVAGVPETLPVNEADDDDSGVVASSEEVDELGLPVAMEAPPSDLEYALSPAEPAAGTGEQDAFDPSLSPFAAPLPAHTISEPIPAGLEALPAAETDDDLSGLLEDDDLSGLLEEDDLSGLAAEMDAAATATTPPPADLTPAPTTFPPANLPPASPPSMAAPVSAPPSPLPMDTAFPTTTPPTVDTPQASSVDTPPPGTPATPPAHTLPAAEIESLGGIAAEKIEVADEDILPEDMARYAVSNIIDIKESAKVEKDEAITARVARYVGRERRENLDKEIEHLYNQVAAELSVDTEDAGFALKTLSEAQDIVLEDTRQYDEALYRVAVVKTMLARKRNLRRWSYTWGSFVFFYALVWLIAFLAGFLFTDILGQITGTSAASIAAVWFSALAGGVGGAIGILYNLYRHVAFEQDFDRQFIMYYLTKPIMGFVLGAVIYFIVSAGFLVFNFAANPAGSGEQVLQSSTVVAIEIVLGFIAGFRQRVVFELIDKIVQRLSPKGKGDAKAAGSASTEESQ